MVVFQDLPKNIASNFAYMDRSQWSAIVSMPLFWHFNPPCKLLVYRDLANCCRAVKVV